jgi:ribosome-associated heat shock protein Hsp15
MAESPTSLRADKYLHHVRIFKTRSAATLACDRGQIRVAADSIKPSRGLRPGDVLHVDRGDLKLIVKVLGFPKSRVGAPLVPEYLEDLTPDENYRRAHDLRMEREMTRPTFDANMTRKDIRLIREWLGRD